MKKKNQYQKSKTAIPTTNHINEVAKHLLIDIGQFYLIIHALACIVFIIWAIKLYEETVISLEALWIPFGIGALLALVYITILYGNQLKWYLNCLIALFVGGITGIYVLLYTNQYFKESASIYKSYYIQERGTFSKTRQSCGAPYVIINIQGIEKRIRFSCDDKVNFDQYKQVELQLSKGYWGIDIINGKKLL